MDVPEHMKPYVPSFKTLFLGVKHVNIDELTQTDHPFGWLMTVLQKELEAEDDMQRALKFALTQLDKLKTENPTLHRNAMIYLSLIVHCRRDKKEQPKMLRMINTHTEDEEVERTLMTGIEALIQQGREQGRINEKRTDVLKIVRHRFADISDTILNEISSIDDLALLDDLFDQVLTAESFEDIDFSKNGK